MLLRKHLQESESHCESPAWHTYPLGSNISFKLQDQHLPLEHNIYLKFPPASKANPLAAPCPITTPAAWSSSSPHHLAAVSPASGGDRQEHSPGCTLAQLHLSGALLQISGEKEDRTSSWGKEDSYQFLDRPKSTNTPLLKQSHFSSSHCRRRHFLMLLRASLD